MEASDNEKKRIASQFFFKSYLIIAIMVDINSVVVDNIPAIARTFISYTKYNVHVIVLIILIIVMFDFAKAIVYIMLPIHGNRLIGPL